MLAFNASLGEFGFSSSRSSHRRCSVKKGVLRNFTKFTGKHLRQRLFFKACNFIKKDCFPVNFAKFLRASFLHNTSGGLLLFLSMFVFSVYSRATLFNYKASHDYCFDSTDLRIRTDCFKNILTLVSPSYAFFK